MINEQEEESWQKTSGPPGVRGKCGTMVKYAQESENATKAVKVRVVKRNLSDVYEQMHMQTVRKGWSPQREVALCVSVGAMQNTIWADVICCSSWQKSGSSSLTAASSSGQSAAVSSQLSKQESSACWVGNTRLCVCALEGRAVDDCVSGDWEPCILLSIRPMGS